MDSLPEIPTEMIGSSDLLEVSTLRLVSRQARSAFTPCASRITVVPTGECDRFLSSMAAPFSSRTVVRLTDASACMSILEKYPGLFCNIKRVVCTEAADPKAYFMSIFNTLFPNVDFFEIRCENDEEPFVVSEPFSKFRQDLKIEALSLRIEAPLNARNLTLGADWMDFDPAVCMAAESVRFVNAQFHRLPGHLTVERDFCLDHCHMPWVPDTAAVLGTVFRTATNVSLLGGDGLRLAHESRHSMAARRLVLEIEFQQDTSMLRPFFAEGPRRVEHLILRGVTMDLLTCLYGLPCLRYLDVTPGISVALRAPPVGLRHLIVRVCSSFFGRDIDMMITYVSVLRTMCRSQGTERLVVLLYSVTAQHHIRDTMQPIMTLHDGAP